MNGNGTLITLTMLCSQLCNAQVSTCSGRQIVVSVRHIALLLCQHGWPVAALIFAHSDRNVLHQVVKTAVQAARLPEIDFWLATTGLADRSSPCVCAGQEAAQAAVLAEADDRLAEARLADVCPHVCVCRSRNCTSSKTG